jgi:translin
MAVSRFRVVRKARRKFEAEETSRERIISLSRDVLKRSKSVIYDAQRNDFVSARSSFRDVSQLVVRLNSLVRRSGLYCVGAYNEALEEFVESACFLSFLSDNSIPDFVELGVPVSVFLQGLCDFTGELVRKGMNEVVSGEFSNVAEYRSFVMGLYDELLLFDWRNTSLRRKFDSIKYGLEKLNDLSLKVMFKV